MQDIFYGEYFSQVREYFGDKSEMDIIEAKEAAVRDGGQAILYGRKASDIFAFLERRFEEPMHILLGKRRQ